MLRQFRSDQFISLSYLARLRLSEVRLAIWMLSNLPRIYYFSGENKIRKFCFLKTTKLCYWFALCVIISFRGRRRIFVNLFWWMIKILIIIFFFSRCDCWKDAHHGNPFSSGKKILFYLIYSRPNINQGMNERVSRVSLG